MSAYIVVNVSVHDPALYEDYKNAAPASIAQYGGRYLVRGGTCAVLEGDWKPGRLVILEFPTAEAALAWWGSTEYAPVKALRYAYATSQMILVEGVAGLG
jgi:uncharacterized protein (DUF1330 family)